MHDEFSAIGKSLVRPDAWPKVTGEAIYTEDIALPGTLEGRILHSPHAHARIVRIDTSKAKALPGVVCVLTHEDVPRRQFTRSTMAEALPDFAYEGEVLDQYILTDKARYVGDCIAAVAAIDLRTAEKALDLIEVEYELLPAVFSPFEAIGPDAPRIHDAKPGNISIEMDHPFNSGDVEEGFGAATHIAEFSGVNSRQKHCHLEPDVAIASWERDGRLKVISPSQGPHLSKKAFARRVFDDLTERDVQWLSPVIGGGFGARLALGVEPIAAMLAKAAGKPVRVTTTREEDFAGYSSRTDQHQTVRIGCTDDGAMTSLDMDITSDAGAHHSHSGTTTMVNMQTSLGLFRCPNVRGHMKIVYTNTPVTAGFRGYGNPEGAFVLQQAVDILAEKVGLAPTEFRLKNAKVVGEPSFFIPVELEHAPLEKCIRDGAAKFGWDEKWQGWGVAKEGRYRRGVGMSIMSHASGAGGFLLEHSNAAIKLNEDGSITLNVSPSEMGQGILGTLAQIAAESVGVKFEDVRIVTGDTDVTLFDIGSHASRSITVIGPAVIDAGEKVKARICEDAVGKFELLQVRVTAADLDVRDGVVFVKSDSSKTVNVADIAHDAIYNYSNDGSQIAANGAHLSTSHHPSFQAGFAEIEVDTLTGQIKLLNYTVAHDIGRAINPLHVEAQLQGAIVQGIGFALTEDFVIDKETGATLSDTLLTYRLPNINDVPDIDIVLVEEPAPFGPYGAKGVGEPGIVNVAPAIANALYDAVGVRVNSLPLSPDKVRRAIKAASA